MSGTWNTNSQIKFQTAMLKSRLWDYSDAYILIKKIMSVTNMAAAGTVTNNNDILDFINNGDRNSFNLKEKTTGETNNKGRRNVEIMVSLLNLGNFWRIFEMPLLLKLILF